MFDFASKLLFGDVSSNPTALFEFISGWFEFALVFTLYQICHVAAIESTKINNNKDIKRRQSIVSRRSCSSSMPQKRESKMVTYLIENNHIETN